MTLNLLTIDDTILLKEVLSKTSHKIVKDILSINTTSFHSPSSLPNFSLVPTKRKLPFLCNLMLAILSEKIPVCKVQKLFYFAK